MPEKAIQGKEAVNCSIGDAWAELLGNTLFTFNADTHKF